MSVRYPIQTPANRLILKVYDEMQEMRKVMLYLLIIFDMNRVRVNQFFV